VRRPAIDPESRKAASSTPKPPCSCVCAKHPASAKIDADLKALGTSAGGADTLGAIAERHGIPKQALSVHRTRHLGLSSLAPAKKPLEEDDRIPESVKEFARINPVPPKRQKVPPRPLAVVEEKTAELVRSIATLIQLGSYRGLSTARALAARHSVDEAEVLRCYRRAAASVKDARGGLREQLELSIGVLTEIRDRERQVAEDYTRVAERAVLASIPRPDAKGFLPSIDRWTKVGAEDLELARSARAIAAQAADTAIAAQRQIDQNTIHRRTATLVQLKVSADPEFGRAYEVVARLVDAWAGAVVPGIREKIDRGLAAWEDGGDEALEEHMLEIRADREAILGEAEMVEEDGEDGETPE
jgi:hypothetical protein